MRKITKLAVDAFYNGDHFKRDNTIVHNGIMQLYRTTIARRYDSKLWLNTDGYYTNTTKERLNGLLEAHGLKIFQKNFKWYIWNNTTEESFLFVDGMEIRV